MAADTPRRPHRRRLQPDDVPNAQPLSLSADDRKRFSAWIDPKAIDDPVCDLPMLMGSVRLASRFTEATPRIVAAEYRQTIKDLRREERTGRRDDEIRARLQNPYCVDQLSYADLASLAANPDTEAHELRRAVEACMERTAAWPRGERFNPRWEAVRIAVIMASAWFRGAGRPELRADKAVQREFVLAVMAKAGLLTSGLRRNPGRLDHDEILGPWLAFLRRA